MEANISLHNPIAKFTLASKVKDLYRIEDAFSEFSILKHFESKSKPFVRLDLAKTLEAFEFARKAHAKLLKPNLYDFKVLRDRYIQKIETKEESRWDDIYAYFTIIELLKDYGLFDITEIKEDVDSVIKPLLPDIKEQWKQLQINENLNVASMEFFSYDYGKLQDKDVAELRLLYAYIFDENIKDVFKEIYHYCDEIVLSIAVQMQRFFSIDKYKVFKVLSQFPNIEQFMPKELRELLAREIRDYLDSFYDDAFNGFIIQYAALLGVIEADNNYGKKLIEMGLTNREEFNEILSEINRGNTNDS